MIKSRECNFLIKVSQNLNLSVMPNGRLPDGVIWQKLKEKFKILKTPPKNSYIWQKETIVVRVIEYQIPGFRPCRIITSILDPKISAKELVIHYHKRWDVEISFDEIKTHQCVTRSGTNANNFPSSKHRN